MARRSTKTVGSQTMLQFALECVSRGAVVSEPFGDDAPYDLVIHVGNQLFKVNVKTAWPSPRRKGVFIFNGTRKVPRNSASGGPSCVSMPYKPGEVDCIVTKAGNSWFFFDDPPNLPGVVEVYPDASPADYRWNAGKDKWVILGLAVLLTGVVALIETSTPLGR